MEKMEMNTNINRSANSQISQRVERASAIIEEYGDFLRTIILFNVKNIHEVDDIIQDFFISLVAHPIRKDIEDIKSYLYRAITNDIIDAKRRTKNYKERVINYATFTNNTAKQQINHEEIIIKNDELKKILKKISNFLPSHEAQALLNYYIFNYDSESAANKMEIDTRTFSRYVCTGIKKFRYLTKLSANCSVT